MVLGSMLYSLNHKCNILNLRIVIAITLYVQIGAAMMLSFYNHNFFGLYNVFVDMTICLQFRLS